MLIDKFFCWLQKPFKTAERTTFLETFINSFISNYIQFEVINSKQNFDVKKIFLVKKNLEKIEQYFNYNRNTYVLRAKL